MKIVVAPDSYKGTLSAAEVCGIWREALLSAMPEAEVLCVPMSDGGDGALEAVSASTHAERRTVEAEDALGRPVHAQYALFNDGQSAFVETAAACGLVLLRPTERNPMRASSRGAGQLIAAALASGAQDVSIGIGGSATVDGGAGLLQALGVRLLDRNGTELPPGAEALASLESIDSTNMNPAVRRATIFIASDVTNPLLGPNGAAAIFAAQKGATPEMIPHLEYALAHFAKVAIAAGIANDCAHPGDGAAGGMGFALRTFLGAHTCSGARRIAALAHIPEHLRGADLLITGEGRSDSQTLNGKLPAVMAELASEAGVPALLCSGAVEDDKALAPHFAAVFSTLRAVREIGRAHV